MTGMRLGVLLALWSFLPGCPRPPGGDDSGETTGTSDGEDGEGGETGGGPGICEPGPTNHPDPDFDYCSCIADPVTGLDCTPNPDFHLIWTNLGCTDCHNGEDGGLDLSPGVARTNLLADAPQSALPRVTPNSPVESYVWHKLNRTNLCPAAEVNVPDLPANDGMPPDGPISGEDELKIETWICCGALD